MNNINLVERARKYSHNLIDVKAGTSSEIANFWKLLTGNYLPAFIPTTIELSVYGNQEQ